MLRERYKDGTLPKSDLLQSLYVPEYGKTGGAPKHSGCHTPKVLQPQADRDEADFQLDLLTAFQTEKTKKEKSMSPTGSCSNQGF